MTIKVHITPDMQRRVADIAKRSGRSESEIIADALEHGHSLEWQERYFAKVLRGLKAADSGDFASDAEIDRVRNKHRAS